MIGTIRKHSSWLWAVIITAIIVSFVFWNTAPATRGGGGTSGRGTLYGQPVTAKQFDEARNEFRLYYFLHYGGGWPEAKGNVSDQEIERYTFDRLLMVRKAAQMGIQIDEDAVVAAAKETLSSPAILRMFRTSEKSIPMDTFTKYVLEGGNLTSADFQRFIRNDLAIQQLVNTFGSSGQIISPQEASVFYDRENQEVAAQAIFFSASNYLSQVTISPAAVAQFYTNHASEYLLPDRVQIKYVSFPVSNFLAQAKSDLSSNLETSVNNVYAQYGMKAAPEAKTEAEAKDKIRDTLIRQRAGTFAKLKANEFENAISTASASTVRADLLDQIALQKGVPVQITAPFGAEYGPEEFFAPQELTKIAFQLNADEPISSPIAGTDAYYIIALARQLPSEIPPFSQIQAQVTRDYQQFTAAAYARQAGTNFVQIQLPIQRAVGKSFAAAADASGLKVEVLPSFSLKTENIPGFEQQNELSLLRRAAFLSTSPGHASPFLATMDGGFVIYVNELLPIDEAKKQADLPEYTAKLRRNRINEAFNEWLFTEGNREFKTVVFNHDQSAHSTPPQ